MRLVETDMADKSAIEPDNQAKLRISRSRWADSCNVGQLFAITRAAAHLLVT